MIQILKSKIHRATVTAADINYVGSITIYSEFMDAAGIFEYEKVLVVDVNNGQRFETYVIKGEDPKNAFQINGASARLVSIGDRIIVMAFAYIEAENTYQYKPKIIVMDEGNKLIGAETLRGRKL